MILDSHMEAANAMSPEAKLAFIDAIVAYTAGGSEPESLPPEAAPAWIIAKKDIDNLRAEKAARSRAGKRSAAKRKRESRLPQQGPNNVATVLQQCSNNDGAELQQSPNRSQLNEKENINEKEREEYQDLGAREAPLPFPPMRGAVYFDPPSAEDVDSYAKANCLPPFDAQSFVDYYEAQGWVMGNGQPMRDWKAAARKWGSGQWRFRADEQKRKEAQDADYDRFECVWEDQQQDQG